MRQALLDNNRVMLVDFLKENMGWLGPTVLAVCAVLTLLLNLLKKENSGHGQNIKNVKNSKVIQAGGSITINKKDDER